MFELKQNQISFHREYFHLEYHACISTHQGFRTEKQKKKERNLRYNQNNAAF